MYFYVIPFFSPLKSGTRASLRHESVTIFNRRTPEVFCQPKELNWGGKQSVDVCLPGRIFWNISHLMNAFSGLRNPTVMINKFCLYSLNLKIYVKRILTRPYLSLSGCEHETNFNLVPILKNSIGISVCMMVASLMVDSRLDYCNSESYSDSWMRSHEWFPGILEQREAITFLSFDCSGSPSRTHGTNHFQDRSSDLRGNHDETTSVFLAEMLDS